MLQVATLVTDETIQIEGIDASDVSYPGFRQDLQQIQREIE
jgi:3-phosphoshikimate 1-carboxyvinyltransferase